MELRQRFPRQRADVAARILGDEAVAVTPADHQVHELDAVATFVWRLCDGKTSGWQIVERLVAEYDVGESEAAAELDRLLETLSDRGLVELLDHPAG